ncbi:HTH-type transcriptional activator RhaS [Neolewinella maritima]|uniref:HTH-type transcriptional activator RhaS n=1 Tax=Neolewinella maritima TaxID=1383882 RepID=A0ABM9AWQ8_9BACT|nr:nickel-binding protein [Neolewinella maritima]CAH0999092.1 HTH-type transcriptional activator RhaS [Neolewinella maritima]
MPLYMDIHVMDTEELLADDVAKAHIEDLKVEERHDVQQLKYWVDTTNKKVFCLMRGPNKAACHAVHRESHGMTACNIVELSEDESRFLLLGSSKNDLAYAESGALDPGYRTLLRLDVIGAAGEGQRIGREVHELIRREEGHVIPLPGAEILAYFSAADRALDCGRALVGLLAGAGPSLEFTLGILTDQILDPESTHLFDEAKQRLRDLARIGLANYVLVDGTTLAMAEASDARLEHIAVGLTVLAPEQLTFLKRALSAVEEEIGSVEFSVARLASRLGISKATTYRTLTRLLDLSPREFIQRIRLHRSLELLRAGGATVAEVAYAVGFSSPSYFTRAFKARFGMLPSDWQQGRG